MSAGDELDRFGGELLSESVKRLVFDRIVRGRYAPGERIVEFQLAKELGVSQSPVREGLRELAAMGIVALHPRRGARVRTPSAKELADMSVVRAEVDALACRLAAVRVEDATLAELEALIDVMVDRLEHRDFPALTEADVGFHHRVAVASGNEPLVRTLEHLAPFERTFLTLTLPDVDVRTIVLDHRAILEPLGRRDGEGAAAAARTHQLDVAALMLATGSPATGEDRG